MKKQLLQPATLEALAKTLVIKWVMWNVKTHSHYVDHLLNFNAAKETEDISHKIETIRNYFKNTPSLITNNLLAELIDHISATPHLYSYNKQFQNTVPGLIHRINTKARWIEIFFTENITTLCLNSRTFHRFRGSLSTKSNLFTGLALVEIHVDLLSMHAEHAICSKYAEFFKKIPDLKHLKITCTSDKILRCILANCKSIVSLDLYEYYNTTIKTLDMISELSNIKRVNLYDSSKESHFDPSRIEKKKSSILEYISSRNKFEIATFVITSKTKTEDFQILKKYTKVRSLEYLKTVSDQQLFLDSLNYLQSLRELKILYSQFYDSQVKKILELVGRQLEVLVLWRVDRLDIQAFEYISLMCPYLKTLTVDTNTYSTDDSLSENRSNQWPTIDTKIPLFKNLHTLDIFLASQDNSLQPSTGQRLTLFVLQNCQNIVKVDLCKMNLSQDFLLQVLDKNPLKYLKELSIDIKLDQIVIDRIKANNLSPEIEYLWEEQSPFY